MQKGKRSFKIFKIILLVIITLFLVRVVQQAYTLYRVRQETIKSEETVKKLEEQKKALEEEKKNLGDLKYVEKLAREEHNMVRKGEIPLFILDDQKKDADNTEKAEPKNKQTATDENKQGKDKVVGQ